MKTAIISGISGQDGAYLSQLLLAKNYKVIGAIRQSADRTAWRLKKLNIYNKIEFIPFELMEQSQIDNIIKEHKPTEFYNLAAMSFVPNSFINPIYTSNVVAIGPLRILESIRNFSPQTKFYQASSSEMFGKVTEIPQKETTPFYPRSPYGVSKCFAHYITVNYREAYNLFACSGILFNHESPLRGIEFVTRKITMGLSKIYKDLINNNKVTPLQMGNLYSKRDWGHTKDYVRAMWMMLQQEKADDYVISTGKTHSVIDFITLATNYYNLKINIKNNCISTIFNSREIPIIKSSQTFYRPTDVDILLGNSTKALKNLGWKPKISFKQLVEEMCESDK